MDAATFNAYFVARGIDMDVIDDGPASTIPTRPV
jgi:hypothetical protein